MIRPRRSARISCLVVLLSGTVASAGCSTIYNKPTEGVYKPISFGARTADGPASVARHFTAQQRASFWFFRLVPANKVNIISIAEKQIGPGEGIVNLRATTEYDLIDFIVGVVTFGIYTTWHIEVSGDVVKLKSP